MKTDDEWTSERDGIRLLRLVRTRSMRKDRFVAIAFARRVLEIAGAPQSEPFLAKAEAYWDNRVTWDEFHTAYGEMLGSMRQQPFPIENRDQQRRRAAQLAVVSPEPETAARHAASAVSRKGKDRSILERAAQAEIVRDIFANPFRPVTFNPRWRTADTVGLARGIYEDRAFDRIPLLADALMDAGCDDEQILSHCRTGGPHVRGCWVVDLVLGKE